MYTLEIAGIAIATTDADEAEAREIFESEDFLDDIRGFTSAGSHPSGVRHPRFVGDVGEHEPAGGQHSAELTTPLERAQLGRHLATGVGVQHDDVGAGVAQGSDPGQTVDRPHPDPVPARER